MTSVLETPTADNLIAQLYGETQAVKALLEAARRRESAPTFSQPAPAAPPAPTPLYEAPCSINVDLELHGRQVRLTLRDSDEGRLLARLSALLERFPVSAPAAPQAQGWCHTHGVQMRQTTKEGRSWWSHRTADGWCKGKLRIPHQSCHRFQVNPATDSTAKLPSIPHEHCH
jgi:hypothetical protein